MGISAPADDSTAEVRATEIGIADAGIASAGNIPVGAAEAGTAEAAAAEAGAPEAGTADDGAAAAGTPSSTAPPQAAPPQAAPPKAPAPPPGTGSAAGAAPAGPRLQGRGGPRAGAGPGGLAGFSAQAAGGHGAGHSPTTAPRGNASLGTAAEVRAAAAAWVASQVSRAKPISCDPVMCQTLHAHGVPAADLLVLKPGGGAPLRSGVIVVTAAVTKMVGTEFLTADAPAAIASFGSGRPAGFRPADLPQGAAAYAAALRQDIAERKSGEAALLENPRVTAPQASRRQLQDGKVDPRLLLTLAQLASQWRLSIVAFGDRAPGASPGVPLRSADLAVTGGAVGQARQMSAFAHGLKVFFTSARIRAIRLGNGQDVVQVEFAAPSPLGLLNS